MAGTLALSILHLLHERPMHPYEIQQVLRERSLDTVVSVGHGSTYHTVQRLHRDGLVESVATTREGRRPERTVYAITSRGCDEYARRLRDLARTPSDEAPSFAAALALLPGLGAECAARVLDERAAALEQRLANPGPEPGGWAGDYLRALWQTELDWLRRTRDTLTDAGR